MIKNNYDISWETNRLLNKRFHYIYCVEEQLISNKSCSALSWKLNYYREFLQTDFTVEYHKKLIELYD